MSLSSSTGFTASSARRPRSAIAAQPENRMAMTARPTPHVITITSGKGGVGKTNLSANLGWQLRQLRKRVLLLDADLGLANVDIILGLNPEFNISHVLNGECTLNDILTKGPNGLKVLPASSGVSSMTELTDSQQIMLMGQMEALQEDFEYLLIDTGAGIAHNVIYFNLAAQTIIVIVTPEPTSLTDAYALIKVLSRDYHQHKFMVLANDVTGEDEGLSVFNKLTRVTDKFLNVSLDYLGCVPHDPLLREAVRMQKPFSEVFPDGVAATGLRKIAKKVAALENDPLRGDLGLLWRNLVKVSA